MLEQEWGPKRESERIEIKFHGTYYFVQIVNAAVQTGSFGYAFGDHFHDGLIAYVEPFRRWSALHVFLEYMIDTLLVEDLGRAMRARYVRKSECSRPRFCHSDPAWMLGTSLMKSHGYDVRVMTDELEKWVERGTGPCCRGTSYDPHDQPDWELWEEVSPDDYYRLVEQLAEECFYVLFANRSFLRRFHECMADNIRMIDIVYVHSEESRFLRETADGVAVRRAAIPEWVKRAVFFRERGRCAFCERDLGGSYSPMNRCQFDHMVPISRGGLNDVSNIQLLCEDCNNRKGSQIMETSLIYERWYPTDRRRR
ncbi:hypothetical protein C5E44_31070 [Nocardia nova]|uniref:HNH endonuclease n=1 Tax=Nocardia nova TaxID=37330 RepID=UPI000CE9B5FF|nr:hypothetical protein C5E44_31070 [Nocardia nova]